MAVVLGLAAFVWLTLALRSLPAGTGRESFRREWGRRMARALSFRPLEPLPERVRAAWLCLSAVSGLAAFGSGTLLLGRPLLAMPAAFLGAALPEAGRRWRVARTRAAFDQQLAGALGTLAGALKAGVGFPQALQGVAARARSPLKEELETVLREHRLGRPLSEALEAWGRRTSGRPLLAVVQTVAVAQAAGAGLSEILLGVSEGILAAERIRARAKALSAQGRLSGWVVGLMPFGLMGGMGVLAPELIRPLFTTEPGQWMFVAVCVLVGAGLFFIHRIVEIEV